MRKESFIATCFCVLLAGMVACGGTDSDDTGGLGSGSVPDKSTVSGGKADGASLCQQLGFHADCDLCAEYGLAAPCDLCAAWNWHDDGICDSNLVSLGFCDAGLEAKDCATVPEQKGYKLAIADGQARLTLHGSLLVDGSLSKDGTAGNSYTVVPEEGYVCGTVKLSKYDPHNEGFLLENAIEVIWNRPDGSIVSTCAPDLVPAEGIYRGSTDLFAGEFTKVAATVTLVEGKGTLTLNGDTLIEGTLERDGSAGNAYALVPEEGFVCGGFMLSKYDPHNEGSLLSNAFTVKWLRPDGSVAGQCAKDYVAVEGTYVGGSDTFSGTFYKKY